MADEPKPTIDKKEETKKTEKLVEPQKQEAPKSEVKKETKPAEAPKKPVETKSPNVQKDSTITKSDKPSVSEDKPKPKETPKKPQVPKIKKTEAVVRGVGLHISTKKSMGICKFIKNKPIEKAIADLELVLRKKKAVPIKGEIPHKKGLGKPASGSGSYPKKASEAFLKLLNSSQANADANGMDEPIISEAVANMASRPFGRFGRVKRKRTHVKIVAKEKKIFKKAKKKGGKR